MQYAVGSEGTIAAQYSSGGRPVVRPQFRLQRMIRLTPL